MKFGLLVEKETRNIGDDIQAYVAKRFLPRIDYYVDRNHVDEFVPKKNEMVATITNGWFLQYTLNWPMSPYIKPLPISMHFTNKDWFWDTTDRAYHLQGYGLEYLKSIEPIGCRDSHTMKLLESKGIKTEYTGCMTLTLKKFEGVKKGEYICAVDVSREVIEKIKQTTNMEVKEITHILPEDYCEKLSWEERMNNVEKLLKVYQGAKAVISYRLHCALPCLALGTPVILLNEEYRNDRFGDYIKYIESCSEEDFINGKVTYDYENIKVHSDEWKELRDDLINRCNEFVKKYENETETEYNIIDVEDYKKYVIKKSNWLKTAALDSYHRFEENKNIISQEETEKNKIIENKNKVIDIQKDTIEYYKKEFNNIVKELEKCKEENDRINNSRWWKLRNKIKKVNNMKGKI